MFLVLHWMRLYWIKMDSWALSEVYALLSAILFFHYYL